MAAPDELPLIQRARRYVGRPAILASDGRASYRQMLGASGRAARALLGDAADLSQARVAYLAPPSIAWVATQWGIWRAGAVAVPLAVSHPAAELEHVIADSGTVVVVAHPDLAYRVRGIAEARGVRLLSTTEMVTAQPGETRRRRLPAIDLARRAIVFYTSGTTARPKGAVLTHANLAAQVQSLVQAWEWTPDDHILGVLPLHHVHGVINVLTCALWAGATCELLPRFDAIAVWDRLASGEVTLFMAVPTVYARLITAWDEASAEQRRRWSAGCGAIRLMVSGSAALPVAVLTRWREITGQVLLERYGMTEIGMALSHPLRGRRVPGYVGTPLPGVEVRLMDDEGRPVSEGTAGEIEVRGDQVFLEYLGNPAATREAFHDGWFRTGDVAVIEDASYRILGRKSVDIIKTGGYKVSALEIEEALRALSGVQECAVVGVPDSEWGEQVCAAVVAAPDSTVSADVVQRWARERLAAYKVPKDIRLVSALPRNAMGKVVKTEVAKLFRGPAGASENS